MSVWNRLIGIFLLGNVVISLRPQNGPMQQQQIKAGTLSGSAIASCESAFRQVVAMRIDKKFKDMSIYKFGFWQKNGRDYVYISPRVWPGVISEKDGLTPGGVTANYEMDSNTHRVLRKFQPLPSEMMPVEVWKNRVFY